MTTVAVHPATLVYGHLCAAQGIVGVWERGRVAITDEEAILLIRRFLQQAEDVLRQVEQKDEM